MLKFAIGLVLLAPGAASAAACHVDPFRMVYGTDSQTHMEMREGGHCAITFHRHAAAVSSVGVAQDAKNGTVSIIGNRWEYRPRSGFTGHDAFVVRASGEYMNNRHGTDFKGATNVAVEVDVMP